MTRSARIWCSALVTWSLAVIAGMGLVVFAPDVLPVSGPMIAPVHLRQAADIRSGVRNAAVERESDQRPGSRQRAADRAVQYAQSRGWRSGIAVVDLNTGETTLAGDATGRFRAESTMKLFVAARLLAEGKVTPGADADLRRMITHSDDEIANALYGSVGGDALVYWIAAQYKLDDLGGPPARGPGMWGSTLVTPAGMANFLAKAYKDPKVGPWLVAAMSQMSPVAADGTNQVMGLRVADQGAAVKQGWGGDNADPLDVTGTPSVGYVDRERFAVAIYTSRMPETPLREAQDIVTAQALLLMPEKRMPRL